MSKKKDQEKFNEYSINTDDAWEIDDRTMTLKILDNDEDDDDLGISKNAQQNKLNKIPIDASNGNVMDELLSVLKYRKKKCFILVRKLTTSYPPGINRRVDDRLNSKTSIPYRYNTNNSSSSAPNNTRANLKDIDQQKENKFKQIFDQSTVDLSKKIISFEV
jgi:hypothetical protein